VGGRGVQKMDDSYRSKQKAGVFQILGC